MAALVAPPLRRSGELPAGTFNYPEKKRGGSKLLLVLLGLAVIGIGFAAFVFLFPQHDAPAAASQTAEVAVATPIADAAVTATPVDAEAMEPEPEIDITTPPPSTSTPRPRPRTTSPGPAATPVTTPTPGPVTAPERDSNSQAEDTVENAPNNPPPTSSDCDEVSCVLAKYDRPCCEKYRPKESAIAPRTADGLPAELDKSMVRAGIAKVKPRVVACGEKSSEKGTVKIAVTVKPDGAVKAASVVASPDPALGDCVAAAIRNAEFGKSVGGGSFTYPFVF